MTVIYSIQDTLENLLKFPPINPFFLVFHLINPIDIRCNPFRSNLIENRKIMYFKNK